MESQMIQIADLTKFYWAIGVLILMNIGTIISIFFAAGRAVWWVSKLDSRVERNTVDVNAAHNGVREIKREMKRGNERDMGQS